MWDTPPRSPTIVGMAVETMVWSRAAISMPAIKAEKMRLTRRRVRTIGGGASVSGACTGAPCVRTPSSSPLVPRDEPQDGAGRCGGSAGWRRQAGGDGGPHLVDEVG